MKVKYKYLFCGKCTQSGVLIYGDLLTGLNGLYYIRHIISIGGNKRLAIESIVDSDSIKLIKPNPTMKKIKIAARAVAQIAITFYQFGAVVVRVLWTPKVEIPTASILMLLCLMYYLLSYYHSPGKYENGIISAYNIGYKQGVETVVNARNAQTDTILVYDKPNGNVIDTILINK